MDPEIDACTTADHVAEQMKKHNEALSKDYSTTRFVIYSVITCILLNDEQLSQW